MAVISDPFTGTDLAGFIPEVWPGIALEALFAKATLAGFFLDLSKFMDKGGDTVHVPDVYTNQFTKQTQTTQGAEITTTSGAQVDQTFAVSVHDYVAFIIGDKDAAQLDGDYDFNGVYARQAAGILRHALEDLLAGLWSGLSTNVIGDTATVLADAEIRQGINALESLNQDTLDGDVAFFFHPYTFYVQLGAISKYYDQGQRGPASAAGFISTGNLGPGMPTTGFRGTLYGIPAYVTSRIVSGLQTYRNLLAHKSAFGYAVQTLRTPKITSMVEGNRVRAQTSYELRNLGWLTVLDMVYNAAELRDQLGVVLNGSSTFIGS